jgi:hypothetical protein
VSSALEDEYEDVRTGGTTRFPPQPFTDSYKVRTPFEFGAGMAWSGGGLTVGGDLVYADLQQARYDEPSVTVGANVDDFARQYRSAFRTHLGLEYRLPGRALAFRAGAYRDPVRYVGGAGQPAVTVTDERTAWTLGAGGVLEGVLALDAALVKRTHRLTEGKRDDDVKSVGVVFSASLRFGAP